jgi:hypothetical protein
MMKKEDCWTKGIYGGYGRSTERCFTASMTRFATPGQYKRIQKNWCVGVSSWLEWPGTGIPAGED